LGHKIGKLQIMPEFKVEQLADKPSKQPEGYSDKDRVRDTFIGLQKEDKQQVPILEILDVQDGDDKGDAGFINYQNVVDETRKSKPFFAPDLGSKKNGVLTNLTGAYGEAIVLKEFRDQTRGYGQVIYEPVSQGAGAIKH
jgi:hypothetical protein